MSAKIIDGNAIAEQIRQEIAQEVEELKAKGITPGLATILVGEDPASQVYVRNKGKACEKAGIYSNQHTLPANTPEDELLKLIGTLNNDPKISGILVQLPLPEHIDSLKVLNAISPDKDVDGFHPLSVGNFFTMKDFAEMQELFLPCTPHGVIELLVRSGVNLSGAEAVVVGRSNIVGKPVAMLLLANNATVTVCHSRTKDLGEVCRRADILIAAIGKPQFIKANMVKEGVVVIDVGVNRIQDATSEKGFRLVGDVDFEQVKEKASMITPVPGGVGPMTITMLLVNTVKAAKGSVK
ncbi:MAG: bifunctional methylenetetrahydrofolate dehydrogenase/methenyltetrahydrofolate cyclohydrolase FolD [bacterium]|nr:bifunctional methylenetetrahydrofolate dehydrogenase/methenyltetrahydrofolate cyclohydrolase FolD [bacterium]